MVSFVRVCGCLCNDQVIYYFYLVTTEELFPHLLEVLRIVDLAAFLADAHYAVFDPPHPPQDSKGAWR